MVHCRSALLAVALAGATTALAAAPAEAPFIAENRAAMTKMMAAMQIKPSGDVDRDFVAMMMPHHQGAIDIARAELKYGHNEELLRLARDIIVEQQHEMLVMHGVVGEPTSAQSTDTPETTSEHATSVGSKKE